MGTLGYKPSGPTPDFLRVELGNPYNYRAYIPDASKESGWATSLTFGRIGKLAGSNADFTGIVLSTNPNPAGIIETTAGQTTNVLMVDGNGGGSITANLLATFKVEPDDVYALAIISIAGVGLGMTGSGNIPGKQSYTFYSRDDGALPPADPMAYVFNSDEGWMAIALNYDLNQPPATPASFKINGVAGSGITVPDLTPTFDWLFSDPNETLSNGLAADYLNWVEYRVTRVSDNHQMYYYSQVGSDAERAARHITETYDGPALTTGIAYTVEARHSDRKGLFSPWTAKITFTPGAGMVSVSGSGLGTPNGKQDTLTPGPFVAKWTHTGGLSTEAAQFWMLDANQKPIAGMQTGDRTKVVANNANISFTFAELTFPDLSLDTDYYWIVRGKASDHSYSGWSTPVKISIDHAPTIPSQLTDDLATSARPDLKCVVVDSDDTVATGLFVKCELINSSNVVSGPYSMALVSGSTTQWHLQTTSTHLPSFGTYTWRAYSGDGFALSGKKTGAESNAVRSGPGTIYYSAGPSVAITAPTNGSTIDDATYTLAWTCATQAAYRITIYDLTAPGSPLLLDTGSVVTTITGYTIPDGLLVAAPNDYRFHVQCADASALLGSDQVDVTLAYTQPASPAGWFLSPVALDGDDGVNGEASAVLGVYAKSTDPLFNYYLITRQPSAGAPDDPQQPAWLQNVKIRREYDINVTSFIDYTPASGMSYQYRAAVVTKTADGKTHSSPYAVGQIKVTFSTTIIFDTTDPLGTRVVLPYRTGRSLPRFDDKTPLKPWGGNARNPVLLKGATFYIVPTDVYPISTGSIDGDNALINQLDALHQSENSLCFRTGFGFRAFGGMVSASGSDPVEGHPRTYSFGFQPTNAREGV